MPHSKPRQRYCIPDPHATLTDEMIRSQIPSGSHVVDLGCGDGRLLASLRDSHGATIQGVEVHPDAVLTAMGRGVPVLQTDLDGGLQDIPDRAFDVAVLSQTLQQVRHPMQLMQEMLRIATRALVVVPNYGHWRVRWEMLRHGRAPKAHGAAYEWYSTPNLHFLTMADFRELCDRIGARVVTEMPLVRGRPLRKSWGANLWADSALYLLERQ